MTERDSKLSRRRVLVGALWSAPAVVIATSLPAAAVSSSPGGLTNTGDNGGRNTTFQFANAVVMYSGTASTAPVTTVQVAIALPFTRVDFGDGLTTNGTVGWTFLSRSVIGSNAVFVFAYGAALDFTNYLASTLFVAIPMLPPNTSLPFTYTVKASGESAGTTVFSNQRDLTSY